MLRYCKAIQSISNAPLKKNFSIDYLQDVEIITRDYHGSLKNMLKCFAEHKVNLSNLETRKLGKHQKQIYKIHLSGQNVLLKISFDKINEQRLQDLIFDLKQRYDHVLSVKDEAIPEVPWYPKDNEDLKSLGKLMVIEEEENKDHPQFTDQEYRQRRETIAKLSIAHEVGQPLPIIDYSKQENETWKKIYSILRQKVEKTMSQKYLKNLKKIEEELGFKHNIPQLRDIDQYLQHETGFRIKAVHGILSQREFLNALGHRIFCCTQYIRHHSIPEYTPEPDIVHEIIGHVPMFADKQVADLSQEIGILSCGANNFDLPKLGSLYWFTLEFGAVKENGEMKGYGAGIASSIGECDNFPLAKFEKFNPFIHCTRAYPVQTVQPTYMYAESFEEAIQNLLQFGENMSKPFKPYYDFTTQEVKSDRRIVTHLNNE